MEEKETNNVLLFTILGKEFEIPEWLLREKETQQYLREKLVEAGEIDEKDGFEIDPGVVSINKVPSLCWRIRKAEAGRSIIGVLHWEKLKLSLKESWRGPLNFFIPFTEREAMISAENVRIRYYMGRINIEIIPIK